MDMRLALFILIFSASAVSAPKIKVLIAKNKSDLLIKGVDVKRYNWQLKKVKKYSGYKSLNFNCKLKDGELKNKLSRTSRPMKLASVMSPTRVLSWEKHQYKGRLHIQTSPFARGCDLINEVPLDTYLATLLAKEMSASWPIEALKAQAVAARSYALHKMKSNEVSKIRGHNTYYDIESSEWHQVSGNYLELTQKTIKAVKQTRGEILKYKKDYDTPVFFHSKCGGRTRLPHEVWQNKVNGYSQVSCPFCGKRGKPDWNYKLSYPELRKILSKVKGKKIPSLNKRSVSIDVKEEGSFQIYCAEKFHSVKKSRVRAFLGRKRLPSNFFQVTAGHKHLTLSGSGYGHGVGLCQFGAKELALRGYTYKEILSHYFPDLKLRKVY